MVNGDSVLSKYLEDYVLEDETNFENEDSSEYPDSSEGDDQNVVEVEAVQGLQDLKIEY
ncbi:hypothetical protein KI387_019946, partial [Taxus chinensis]